MHVLVAGGTGFVGGRVAEALHGAGHQVDVMTRSPSGNRDDGITEVRGDIGDESSLDDPLRGVDMAYYFVHSLDRADFAEFDAAGARAFGAAAARAGVDRIVYLGGLGADDDDLSEHLRSRRDVEHILAEHVPTVALRAGIVVGQGSISWELLCQLVEHLPVMITPKWVRTTTQPIAIDDMVAALVAAAGPDVPPGAYDVGAPEALTYADMLRVVARHMDRRLLIVPVPLLSPGLSSLWLRLVTDVDLQTARSLVDSMTNDVVVTDRRLEVLTGLQPASFDYAVTSALAERNQR
ncbi:NAD(P)H-binding protein [soil metagenome]